MQNMLKHKTQKIFILLNMILIMSANSFAGDPSEIIEIKEQFKFWQAKNINDSSLAKNYYHLVYGSNYEKDEWADKHTEDSSKLLVEQVQLYESKKLGSMFKLDETPPSGDWSAYSEHYYWPTGEIFFIFWSLNTYQSSEPLTVERRLYFNKNGDIIRELESVYKMNTKEKVKKPDYFDREVKYWSRFSELPFHNLPE